MYCSKCGNMISDDSVFCNKCGARIGMGSGGAVMKPEIDREALKLYLHDLLALECIRRKYLLFFVKSVSLISPSEFPFFTEGISPYLAGQIMHPVA